MLTERAEFDEEGCKIPASKSACYGWCSQHGGRSRHIGGIEVANATAPDPFEAGDLSNCALKNTPLIRSLRSNPRHFASATSANDDLPVRSTIAGKAHAHRLQADNGSEAAVPAHSRRQCPARESPCRNAGPAANAKCAGPAAYRFPRNASSATTIRRAAPPCGGRRLTRPAAPADRPSRHSTAATAAAAAPTIRGNRRTTPSPVRR